MESILKSLTSDGMDSNRGRVFTGNVSGKRLKVSKAGVRLIID